MKVFVTGAAGFIGAALAIRLLERGDEVVGIDNLDPYYDVSLKQARLERVKAFAGFRDVRAGIADRTAVAELFARERPDAVVNLAAQAGVRYSMENPHAYVDANLVGFINVLEGCRRHGVGHLVYASSSSVYGANRALPFSVRHNVDHPLSLYAATKKANELMAHSYSHLYGLPATGLRFFTVYGPWGRPDMAPIRFTRNILEGRPIDVFNDGDMKRDFTYIDDIVPGVIAALDSPPDAAGGVPHRLDNIGNQRPEPLMRLIAVLEDSLGLKAEINFRPLQPGDIRETCADISAIRRDLGYAPATPIDVGVPRFVEWFKGYHGIDAPGAATDR